MMLFFPVLESLDFFGGVMKNSGLSPCLFEDYFNNFKQLTFDIHCIFFFFITTFYIVIVVTVLLLISSSTVVQCTCRSS
jgi:hypothetical protein